MWQNLPALDPEAYLGGSLAADGSGRRYAACSGLPASTLFGRDDAERRHASVVECELDLVNLIQAPRLLGVIRRR